MAVGADSAAGTGTFSRCRRRLGPVPMALAILEVLASVPALFAQEPHHDGFRDCTARCKLELANSHACWVDVDNDGWVDLCVGGVLWRNHEGASFDRLADGLGEIVAADFDNDGDADLFSWSSLQLFRNDSGTRFTAIEMPELPKCVACGACWGDFNRDGYADLYVGGYEDWDADITYPDLLLINDRGTSLTLNWSDARYRAQGVTACDFDRDGDLDVYVSNYRLQPNVLWRNNGKGEFADAAGAANAVGTAPGFEGGHSIGAAWGDFDNDGWIDLFVGNFAHVDGRGDQPKSRFLRHPGDVENMVFEDRGPGGVFYQESYASPAAADFDNDGDQDLYFTTVYEIASFGRNNNPALFRNDGDFTFADATAEAGLSSLPPTRQAAWADFDHDGDLDLVTAGRLFENVTEGGRWLAVRLQGDGVTVDRQALGAQVRIPLGRRTLVRQVEAGTGAANQNDLTLHFGLGADAGPVRLEILWPGGMTQVVENVETGRLATVGFRRN